MTDNKSAGGRTRHVKSVLRAAGIEARVRSTSPSHYDGQLTFVDQAKGLDPYAVTTCLQRHLEGDAILRTYDGFVSIRWL